MSTPGFTAEASLSFETASRARHTGEGQFLAVSGVQPQSLRSCILSCDEICAGDLIGACMPWCLCRCRGGRNCGLPS